MHPTVQTATAEDCLQAVRLDNDLLSLTILPELGGRLYSIVYKPHGREILWQNRGIDLTPVPFGSPYDDVWCGGWEELFPNDAPATVLGQAYPDHGEVWAIPWSWDCSCGNGFASVLLACSGPISGIDIQRRITIHDGSQIRFEHRLTNRTGRDFPFLWKLHAALAVSESYRLDFPRMTVELEPSFLGTLGSLPPRFTWPGPVSGTPPIDLRHLPRPDSGEVYFFYGTQYSDGWCAVTDTQARLSYGLVFPPDVFPSCWLFGSFGGWRDHSVVVLEPSTTYPLELETAIALGRASVLPSGSVLKAETAFIIQEGLTSVGGVVDGCRFVEA